MLTNSYRTRGANFAFLAGPPRDLTRHMGMEIHSAVCEALGADDLSFKYTPGAKDPEAEQPFAIHLGREQGPEKLAVEINGSVQNTPLRIFLGYEWPRSSHSAFEDFDLVTEAVFTVLGDGWQRVLAEARVRGQLHAKGDSAVSYLGRSVLPVVGGGDNTGDLAFLAFKYETVAEDFPADEPLASPKREVSVEVLRSDPRCIYVEVMSQWPQIAASPGASIQVDPDKVRSFESPPSEYLADTMSYVDSVVLPLLADGKPRDDDG